MFFASLWLVEPWLGGPDRSSKHAYICVSVLLFADFGLCVGMAMSNFHWVSCGYDAVDGWMDGLIERRNAWVDADPVCMCPCGMSAWGALAVAWAFRKCSHALSVTVSPSLSFTWPGAISGSNRWVWRSRGTLSQSWVPYSQTCKGSHFSVIYKQVKCNKASETEPTKSKHSGVTQQLPSIFFWTFWFNIFSNFYIFGLFWLKSTASFYL